jgi:hypothetical protein
MADSIADAKYLTAPLKGGLAALTPLTVTVANARTISGLGATTIWGLIKDKKLETVHVGRRTLITFRSLEALLAPCLTTEPQPRRRGRPGMSVGTVASAPLPPRLSQPQPPHSVSSRKAKGAAE